MSKQHSTILSYLTLILAAAALINSTLPRTPTASGAALRQEAAQPVTAANTQAQANAQEKLSLESVIVASTVPTYIGYQGVLRDGEGKPIVVPVNVTFRIYDAPTGTSQCGETLSPCKWEEPHTNVTVRDGRFSVLLGDSGKPIPPTLMTSPNRFIGVQVDGYQEMQPRQKFSSVPYAMWTERAATAAWADSAGQAANAANAGRANSAASADTLVPGATVHGSFSYENAGSTLNFGTGAWVDIDSHTNNISINTGGGHELLLNSWDDSGAVRVGHDLLVEGSVIGNCNCAVALFALNAGQQALESGDIVTLRGITKVDFQTQPLLNVGLANTTDTIIGVVQGGAELNQPSNAASDNTSRSLVSKGETAQPGNYVTIITNGVAQVKTSAVSGVKSGTALTIGTQLGRVQTLDASTQALANTAGRPSIVGTALEDAQPGQQRVWVLVNPR